MSWDIDIAKQFKSRDNEIPIGPVLGEVISISPLKISVFGNRVILTEKQCYLCSNIVNNYIKKANLNIKAYNVNINATDSNGDSINSMNVNDKNDYDAEISYKDILAPGDKVLCIPTADGQSFFIVDKVVV